MSIKTIGNSEKLLRTLKWQMRILTLLAYEDNTEKKKIKRERRKEKQYKMAIHSSSTVSLCLDSESLQSQSHPLINTLRKEKVTNH